MGTGSSLKAASRRPGDIPTSGAVPTIPGSSAGLGRPWTCRFLHLAAVAVSLAVELAAVLMEQAAVELVASAGPRVRMERPIPVVEAPQPKPPATPVRSAAQAL
jgi:hypothetical protein